jgi:hypothetical protein
VCVAARVVVVVEAAAAAAVWRISSYNMEKEWGKEKLNTT